MAVRGSCFGRHLGTVVVALLLGVAGIARPAGGQAPPPKPGDQANADLNPAQLQRLFDDYVVVQARRALALTDAQFPDVRVKLRALQEARRLHARARRQVIAELAKLTAPGAGAVDEAQIRDRLRALSEVEQRGAEEVRKAQEALDQALTPRQQARFRVFEDQVERRKLDLLLRARGYQPPPPPAVRGR